MGILQLNCRAMRHKYSSLYQGHSLAWPSELSKESSNPADPGHPKKNRGSYQTFKHPHIKWPATENISYLISILHHFLTILSPMIVALNSPPQRIPKIPDPKIFSRALRVKLGFNSFNALVSGTKSSKRLALSKGRTSRGSPMAPSPC